MDNSKEAENNSRVQQQVLGKKIMARSDETLNHIIKSFLGDSLKTSKTFKNFCASKDIIKKVKRQPTEREKRFASHISDEGLVSRI